MKASMTWAIKWILDHYMDELDGELRKRGKHIHENPKKGKVGRTRKPKIEIVKEAAPNDKG